LAVERAREKVEAGVRKALEDHEARQRDIEAKKRELAEVQAKIRRVEENARAYGSLTIPERIAVDTIVKQAKARGFGSLLPDEVDLLRRGGFAEYVEREVGAIAKRAKATDFGTLIPTEVEILRRNGFAEYVLREEAKMAGKKP
jgi:hypothetical protein